MPTNAFWGISRFRSDSTSGIAAAQAESRARDAKETAMGLEERLDKLTLVCTAMWELLREKTKLTEEDLLHKVQELDMRDGVPDGKVTRTVAECPHCHRTMSPRHQKCLYCGYEKLLGGAFDSI
jgi:hypothetical protein